MQSSVSFASRTSKFEDITYCDILCMVGPEYTVAPYCASICSITIISQKAYWAETTQFALCQYNLEGSKSRFEYTKLRVQVVRELSACFQKEVDINLSHLFYSFLEEPRFFLKRTKHDMILKFCLVSNWMEYFHFLLILNREIYSSEFRYEISICHDFLISL